MTAFFDTVRLLIRKVFGEDKDVAKRELFDPDHDDYMQYLRGVKRETRENALTTALLERSRE